MTLAALPRGLAGAGRRCRTSAPVLLPLVQRGLDASSGSSCSRQAVGAYPAAARGYARSAAAASLAAAAAPPTTPWHWARPEASSRARGGQASMMFSTSADASAKAAAGDDAGGEGGGGSEAVSQEGAGGGEEATAPLEENPLEGMVADDGDPGPPPPLDPSIVTEPSPKVLEVMEGIDSLNFVETAMLIELFKNKLGLEEVPTLNYGGSDGGGGDSGGEEGDAPAAAADKTIFKLKVTGFGDKAKIKVIKEVRVITGLGLREAKEMVESLPQVVKEDLKEDEAEELKTKLEAAGATVELE